MGEGRAVSALALFPAERSYPVKKANLISACIGMAFSGLAFWKTFTFKEFKNVPVGPEVFPRALAVALFVCCLALFLANLKDTEDNKEPAPTLSLKDAYIRKALLSFVIMVVYTLLWEPLGFLLVTPFALFALIYLMGKRTWGMMVLVSLLAPVVVFLVFHFLLGITLPMGVLDLIPFFNMYF